MFMGANPFPIFFPVKEERFKNDGGIEGSCRLLRQGEINHSVPAEHQLASEPAVPFGPVEIGYIFPHSCLSIFKLFLSAYRRFFDHGGQSK